MAKLNTVVKREVKIKAPVEKVFELLSDYERSASHVPDLEKIEKRGEIYHWEFKPVGVKGINVKVQYDVRFSNIPQKEVSWETIPGSGNAEVKGKFELKGEGDETSVTLTMDVTVDAPIPRLMTKLAKPILESEIKNLVEGYLTNIRKTLEG